MDRKQFVLNRMLLLLVAATSVASAEEPAVIQVRGLGFSVERLEEGRLAFSNRKYVWTGLPEALRGWQFTRLGGGERASLTVTAHRDVDVHLATAPSQPGVEFDGWVPVEGWTFRYTDAHPTRMAVYRRRLPAGESLDIPQGNWTGGIVLAPRIEAAMDLSLVPGVVIDHQPAASGMYVGSPSIAALPDGGYVASHDLFGPKSTYRERAVTRLFRSADRGKTWNHLTDIQGQFWSNLFVHRGDLYLMGTFAQYKHTVIRRSTDGGRTWTEPKDGQTGRLLEGPFHCAPMPVVEHGGRLWRAMEDSANPRQWGIAFRALMLSAPVDADLLRAESWTSTNRLPGDAAWLDGKFNGWLEGNAVVTPQGRIVDVLRVDTPEGGAAAVVEVSEDGKAATFDPATGFIDFPGGAKKFTIRFDPESKHYWSLASIVVPKHAGHKAGGVRNTLALTRSADLRHWAIRSILLYHPDVAKHGFQYPDWRFDGPDIIAAIRTGYDDGLGGAHNAHDANFLTFHRFENFRELSMADSVVEPGKLGIQP